jgi:hypothetical protein
MNSSRREGSHRDSSGSTGGSSSRDLGEYYYFQAELPPELLADVDMDAELFLLPELDNILQESSSGSGATAAAGFVQQEQQEQGSKRRRLALRRAQAPRLWVSPQGAVSPTHFDLAHSFLAQVRGR